MRVQNISEDILHQFFQENENKQNKFLTVGGGLHLFRGNTLQFGAINKAVFLNTSHRFDGDYAYGEIMRRFRIGLVTK